MKHPRMYGKMVSVLKLESQREGVTETELQEDAVWQTYLVETGPIWKKLRQK